MFARKCRISLEVALHGALQFASVPTPKCLLFDFESILHPPTLLMPISCLALGVEQEKLQGCLRSVAPLPAGPWALLGARLAYADLPTGTWQGRGGQGEATPCLGFSLVFVPSFPSLYSGSFQKKRVLCGRGRKPEQARGVPQDAPSFKAGSGIGGRSRFPCPVTQPGCRLEQLSRGLELPGAALRPGLRLDLSGFWAI